MKDHEIRELVNELTRVAKVYHGAGCLREVISRTVKKALAHEKDTSGCVLSPTNQESRTNSDVD